MCLYIGYKRSFIAKSDIEVYKEVIKDGRKYYTSCLGYLINTNKVMKPNKEGNIILNYGNKYCIEDGAIHAFTTTHYSGSYYGRTVCLKAIIKRGTEFYIQDDLSEVAAKELYITNEEVTDKRSTDLSEYLRDAIKDAETNVDGVRIGYYRLSNGSFVNPLEYKEGTIIGVVAFFDRNNDPISISVKFEKLPWLKKPFKNTVSSNILNRKTIEDMNGMRHTKDILNSKDYDPDNYAAIGYCNNYSTVGTNPGDWYMPAIGECVKITQNSLIINMSLLKAGFDILAWDFFLWSSSERNDWWLGSCAWRCDVGSGYCIHNSGRGSSFCVCPCLSSTGKSQQLTYY